MSHLKELVKDVKLSLKTIFNKNQWTSIQHDTFKAITYYYNLLKFDDKRYELSEDIETIRHNLNYQQWYVKCNAKKFIAVMLEKMKLHVSITEKDPVSPYHIFSLKVSFIKFYLIVNYYKNLITDTTDYVVVLENINTHEKAYLCYYIQSPVIKPIDDVFSLIIPDISRMYKVTEFTNQIIKPYDLINLFIDIITYYDSDIKCIEKMYVSFKIHKSLKKLMELLIAHDADTT